MDLERIHSASLLRAKLCSQVAQRQEPSQHRMSRCPSRDVLDGHLDFTLGPRVLVQRDNEPDMKAVASEQLCGGPGVRQPESRLESGGTPLENEQPVT